MDEQHVFIVGEVHNNGKAQRFISNEFNGSYAIYTDYSGKVHWLYGNTAHGNGAVRSVPHVEEEPRLIYGYKYSLTNTAKLESGSEYSKNTTSTFGPLNIRYGIGRSIISSSLRPLNGYIYEIIIYDGSLSNSEVEQIKTYLNDKWSLESSALSELDTDQDSMPDEFETAHGLNQNQDDASDDLDGDKVSNLEEYLLGTSPSLYADTDLDGIADDYEIKHGLILNFDDSAEDLDDDRVSNLNEFTQNSAASENNDLDGDGMSDDFETF